MLNTTLYISFVKYAMLLISDVVQKRLYLLQIKLDIEYFLCDKLNIYICGYAYMTKFGSWSVSCLLQWMANVFWCSSLWMHSEYDSSVDLK